MSRIIIAIFLLNFVSCNEQESEPKINVNNSNIELKEIIYDDTTAIIKTVKRKLLDFDKVLIKKNISIKTGQPNSITNVILDSNLINILKDSINTNPNYGYMPTTDSQGELHLYKKGCLVKSLGYLNMQGNTIVYDGHKKISKFKTNFIDTLSTSNNLNRIVYNFESVSAGREALKFCQINEIPYQDGIRLFSKWMEFDGEFIFSYSDLTQNRNDDSIEKMVQNDIPIEKFEITTPQSLSYYDSVKLTYRVYCDSNSYKNFITQEHRKIKFSEYKEFKPSLILYASEKSIPKINKLKNYRQY
ncbi:MAG: hypothetical protein ACI9N1_000236 [Flavobacteriales bacterium]|jgi:hypothetical protein